VNDDYCPEDSERGVRKDSLIEIRPTDPISFYLSFRYWGHVVGSRGCLESREGRGGRFVCPCLWRMWGRLRMGLLRRGRGREVVGGMWW
jgi:hypothetical protein